MFNLLSIIVGGLTLVLALIAFVPLLHWANWLLIPVAAVGLVLGVLSRSTTGRNLNLVVLAICAVRLMIGDGIA